MVSDPDAGSGVPSLFTTEANPHEHNDAVIEQIVGRLSLDPTVSAASWNAEWIAQ
jgi:hypothetical protein